MHEAQLYERNVFITLTYDNENLPENRSLDLTHFQKFMKRLRKKFGANIRFYHCGEYGDRYGRPHYHACIFNLDFPDKTIIRITPQGHKLYASKTLDDLWGFGLTRIGDVTFESAAYCARYIMKKITGDPAKEHYEYVSEDGEIFNRVPEYTTMSRRPGIGAAWLDKYYRDVYPSDEVIINGKRYRPPKAYDARFEIIDPDMLVRVKHGREVAGFRHRANNTPDRLKVREAVQRRKLERLKRNGVD